MEIKVATRISFFTVIIVGMAFTLQFATVTHADDIDHYSDRYRLQTALKTGEPRNFYRHEIETLGWQITSVNYDKPEYVEYEIVKGEDLYEVQIAFDNDSRIATKVDVTVTHVPYLPAWFSFFRD
jgi:hypothetical protein